MHKRNLNHLFVLIFCMLAVVQVQAEEDISDPDPSTDIENITFEVELDPYYSNIAWYFSLDDKAIPVIEDDKEENLYKKLLFSTLAPQFMLVEFSVNPLPIAGVYIRKNHPATYDDANLQRINLVKAITAGFEEPYALSLFFGSVVQYTHHGARQKNKNKGFMGYLLSIGDQHIVNNLQVDDQWYEVEWKIKGDLDFDEKILSWSFRAGGKVHSHADIQDVVYLALRRNHFNHKQRNFWTWLNNSDLEYTIELNNENGELVQQQILMTKKWGFDATANTALNFGIGLIQQRDKYTGSLANDEKEYQLIIRSNFQF